ncbi:MAG: 2-C-methyl-D-erythritol 4-phosphate cytidylyltransferase [Fidelibacterota bacterium]|mgnify:CR=1 FL=1|jgi:2-C-methyl-D-erythritol 4-phosphate cytidylyltransferase|tara:strand:- start:1390 stop:2070 length:681 start_codon:yes stop_codon:yes gene_type:complete
MKITAIIPAAGAGERFGEKKQLKLLNGRPLIFHTIQPFINSELINEIIVVVPKENVNQVGREFKSTLTSKKIEVISGGKTRQQSVNNGLKMSNKESELICIHDGVRPFLTVTLIEKVIKAAIGHDGAILATPSSDTIKRVLGNQILETLPREEIWRAQTPQVFLKSALEEAIEIAIDENLEGTDEASILEKIGYQIGFIEGSSLNIKITTKEDWIFAKAIYNELND